MTGFVRVRIIARVVAVVLGGYGATASVIAGSTILLPMVSALPRAEAYVLATMLGFVLYLVLGLWAAVAPNLLKVWFVLGGLSAFGFAAAWLKG
jgi:hypothetical protein